MWCRRVDQCLPTKKRRLDLPKLLVNTFRANLDLIKTKKQPFKKNFSLVI